MINDIIDLNVTKKTCPSFGAKNYPNKGNANGGNIFISKPTGIKKHITFDDVDTMTFMADPLQINSEESNYNEIVQVPTLCDLLSDYLAFEDKFKENQESMNSTIIQKSNSTISTLPLYNESPFFKGNNFKKYNETTGNEYTFQEQTTGKNSILDGNGKYKNTKLDKSFNELRTNNFGKILSMNQQINLDIDEDDIDKQLLQSRFTQKTKDNKDENQNVFAGKNMENLEDINTMFISNNINKFNQLNFNDESLTKDKTTTYNLKQDLYVSEGKSNGTISIGFQQKAISSILSEICLKDVSKISNRISELIESFNVNTFNLQTQDIFQTYYYEESINSLLSLILESQKNSFNQFQRASGNLLNIQKKALSLLNQPKGTINDLNKALNVIQKQNRISNIDESFHYSVICNYLPFKVMILQTKSQSKIKIISKYKQISNPQLLKNDFSPIFSYIAIHSRNKKYNEEMTNLMKKLPFFMYDQKNVSFLVSSSSNKSRFSLVFKIPSHYPWCKLPFPLIRVDYGISYNDIEKIISDILNSLKFGANLLTNFVDKLLSVLS